MKCWPEGLIGSILIFDKDSLGRARRDSVGQQLTLKGGDLGWKNARIQNDDRAPIAAQG